MKACSPTTKYDSEWGNNPEQARLIREFMYGVGEIISGIFCVKVSGGLFGAIGLVAATDGVSRIYSFLNSFWASHQAELYALQEWEKTALKPSISQI